MSAAELPLCVAAVQAALDLYVSPSRYHGRRMPPVERVVFVGERAFFLTRTRRWTCVGPRAAGRPALATATNALSREDAVKFLGGLVALDLLPPVVADAYRSWRACRTEEAVATHERLRLEDRAAELREAGYAVLAPTVVVAWRDAHSIVRAEVVEAMRRHGAATTTSTRGAAEVGATILEDLAVETRRTT